MAYTYELSLLFEAKATTLNVWSNSEVIHTKSEQYFKRGI